MLSRMFPASLPRWSAVFIALSIAPAGASPLRQTTIPPASKVLNFNPPVVRVEGKVQRPGIYSIASTGTSAITVCQIVTSAGPDPRLHEDRASVRIELDGKLVTELDWKMLQDGKLPDPAVQPNWTIKLVERAK